MSTVKLGIGRTKFAAEMTTVQVTGEKRTGYKVHADHNVTPIQNENSGLC